jgi:hypothetical protein
VRRLLPLLLGGALLGLGPVPALAQNVCSPSTAASTVRYPGYPSSMPYSGSTTNITSNCSGPTTDVQITPDPYAGQAAYPVPGYPYGPMTVTASAMPSADPASLYGPTGSTPYPATSVATYAAPESGSFGPTPSYSPMGMAPMPSAFPGAGMPGAPSMGGYGGYAAASPYGAPMGYPGGYAAPGYGYQGGYQAAPYGYPGGYQAAGYGYPGGYQPQGYGYPGGYQAPGYGYAGGYQAAGYGYPGYAPYGGGYGMQPGGYPGAVPGGY